MLQVNTFEQLNKISLGTVGRITPETTLEQIEEHGRAMASEKGLHSSRLLVALEYKKCGPEGEKKFVVNLTQREWDDDMRAMNLIANADVHLVDGNLYTGDYVG